MIEVALKTLPKRIRALESPVPSLDITDVAVTQNFINAPPGLYRVRKLSNQIVMDKVELAIFKISLQKSGWSHRKLKIGKGTLHTYINYVEKGFVLGLNLVWRLQASLQNSTQYHLGF